jgi:hypothetical protein
MRRTLFLATILFSAPLLRAQSTGGNAPTATEAKPQQTCGFAYGNACGVPTAQQIEQVRARVEMMGRSTCPVGFYAGHSNSLTQLRAQDARPGLISQSLNVRMDNSTRHDIVSAQITVHGLSPHYRLTPANADAAANGDLTKHMQLDLTVDAGRHGDTDLRIYGFTSVQRIDLDSLTYADGTTWTASAERRCSVAPNGMMLVAAAQ